MSGKNINFDDKNIKKITFYKNKTINNMEDIDINNILVSKKEPYNTKNSLKYFRRHPQSTNAARGGGEGGGVDQKRTGACKGRGGV